MVDQEWVADQIEVVVSGFLTTRHDMGTPAGPLGELTLPAFRMGGLFRGADGGEIEVRQPSWWKSEHELRQGEALLAVAWPRGFFQQQIEVRFGDQVYMLDRASFWNRSWRLVDAQGRALLEIEPRGIFRRGAYLKVLGEVELPLLVFAYYLIHKRWETEAAAAAAAS